MTHALTPLLLVYKIFVLQLSRWFCAILLATMQLHNLSGDCPRELFKCSIDAASLLDSNEEN